MRFQAVVSAAVLLGCTSGQSDEPRSVPSPEEVSRSPERSAPSGAVFEADSAWAYLSRQIDFGPRVPGTEAHRQCREWLAATLESFGGEVDRQNFSYLDPEGVSWPLTNIRGRFGPSGSGRLLLVAHWDCRPWSDQDPDPARREEPVIGANDAASGVAVLLEVARNLAATAPPQGVDILFVDGEDLGRTSDPEGYCQGSLHAASLGGMGVYRRGIVLDMVGDADLRFPIEKFSLRRAPEVVDWVWQRGTQLSPGTFTYDVGIGLFDDHIPFLDAGVPMVDIIDFEYPAWHTTADDLGAVDRRSLEKVGRVVLDLVLNP